MLAAVKGRVQGNTVLIDEDIRAYDGTEVIVTFLSHPKKTTEKPTIVEREPKKDNDLFFTCSLIDFFD